MMIPSPWRRTILNQQAIETTSDLLKNHQVILQMLVPQTMNFTLSNYNQLKYPLNSEMCKHDKLQMNEPIKPLTNYSNNRSKRNENIDLKLSYCKRRYIYKAHLDTAFVDSSRNYRHSPNFFGVATRPFTSNALLHSTTDVDNMTREYHSVNLVGSSHCSYTTLFDDVTSNDHPRDIGMPPVRTYRKQMMLDNNVDIAPGEVKKFLMEKDMKVDQGYTCFMSTCPRHTKKATIPDSEKLYINMTTGYFVCHSCQKAGSWIQLQDNLTILHNQRRKKSFECFKSLDLEASSPESGHLQDILQSSISVNELPPEQLSALLSTHDCKDLSIQTLQKFKVLADPENDCFIFPAFYFKNNISSVKKVYPKLGEDGTVKSMKESTIPRISPPGLFGWNTVTMETTDVVLTTNELDAMSVQQETKTCALALPRGHSALPQEVLPLLEQFKKIILWFGNDMRSWEAAKQFAKKLNDKRCHVIRPTTEDPSAHMAMKQDLSLRRILDKARPISHQSITSFSQLRHEIYSELSHVQQVSGVKWKKYPQLNKLLKGHRRGELTVFTGPTGCGKTTFISDYSLDLCMQGVNTLWGSFEINNVRLGKMMLTQLAGMNITNNLEKFDHWADQFEQLPMYFMTFYGQENIKKVIETMSHAVYVHDIAHVIVDNLQFMMGVDMEKIDRFHKQDQIIAAFRRFATNMHCHVTLVIHPRKEKDSDELTTASVFGSAKATQEADNVIILQDQRMMANPGKKYIQITKNRFDGEIGIMMLKFDKESLSFSTKPTERSGKKAEDKRVKQNVAKESEIAENVSADDS